MLLSRKDVEAARLHRDEHLERKAAQFGHQLATNYLRHASLWHQFERDGATLTVKELCHRRVWGHGFRFHGSIELHLHHLIFHPKPIQIQLDQRTVGCNGKISICVVELVASIVHVPCRIVQMGQSVEESRENGSVDELSNSSLSAAAQSFDNFNCFGRHRGEYLFPI